MTTEPYFDGGSFREKESRVFRRGDGVFRALSAEALKDWERLSATSFYSDLSSRGKIIPTHLEEKPPAFPEGGDVRWVAALQHEKLPFISYPYEWTFSMLQDAALLQMELLQKSLEENMTLKDSPPYNVQWRGSSPVFIDIGSFAPWVEGTPWVGYRQFCELYLYPLMLSAYAGMRFQPWLRGSLEGIPSKEMKEVLGWRRWLKAGVFKHVYLHDRFQQTASKGQGSTKNLLQSLGYSREMLKNLFKQMEEVIGSLSWHRGASSWSAYSLNLPYDETDRQAKAAFVGEILSAGTYPIVWDLGCNQGDYARLAADKGSYVVAIDSDDWTVESLYRRLRSEKNSGILPLVMNLADPSPNLGWRSNERLSVERRQSPSLILALAVMHHLVITSNIPLDGWIDWLASFAAPVVLEYVDPSDEMVQLLRRNKEGRNDEYNRPHLEDLLSKHFTIQRRISLKGERRFLYHCLPK